LSHSSAVPSVVTPPAVPTPLPLRDVAPWAILGILLALVVLYFVGAEDGAASLVSNGYMHEFVHDGRHLLAFPCH
jgi:Probable cobalt transporter subunit (CbtB)